MEIKTAYLIYFSPTHTSKKVAKAIAKGMRTGEVVSVDITTKKPGENLFISSDSLVVLALPVYAGHVPALALERLSCIYGSQTPILPVAVYGNRAYEHALEDMRDWARAHGFKVIGGATFVGEHSYSTVANPVAVGRPGQEDLDYAEDLGRKLMLKMQSVASIKEVEEVNITKIPRPKQSFFLLLGFIRKVIALKKSGLPLPSAPWVADKDRCTHCGACVSVCPAGAITKGDEWHTDAEKCLKCCACVKFCPQKARTYETPFAALLAHYFRKPKENKYIL